MEHLYSLWQLSQSTKTDLENHDKTTEETGHGDARDMFTSWAKEVPWTGIPAESEILQNTVHNPSWRPRVQEESGNEVHEISLHINRRQTTEVHTRYTSMKTNVIQRAHADER